MYNLKFSVAAAAPLYAINIDDTKFTFWGNSCAEGGGAGVILDKLPCAVILTYEKHHRSEDANKTWHQRILPNYLIACSIISVVCCFAEAKQRNVIYMPQGVSSAA